MAASAILSMNEATALPSSFEVQMACDSAVWALSSAIEMNEVAETISVLNMLSMKPADTALRAAALLKIRAAKKALQPGTSPDYWLDHIVLDEENKLDHSAVDRIAELVQSREHQMVTLRNIATAIS